jgi:ATP-dependent Lhr-like helicase
VPLAAFHPVIADWFRANFNAPSQVQSLAWPAIQAGEPTLIAAPTGSGKTLAAFLAAIDLLLQEGLQSGLPDETRVLYISPLKALSNDIYKNLAVPLAGIRLGLLEQGLPDVAIRAQTRTGDTTTAERNAMKRLPPHILVTTPESVYLLLTSVSGRQMLKSVRTVIVDEIHALAGNKRGAHLMLSLERLSQLVGQAPVRIGLSATQKPIQTIANYLTGAAVKTCRIIDVGHSRQRDLQIEVTGSPLEAVMAAEVWGEVYGRLEQLITDHRTTLIFVNTRRLAERAAAALAERLGEANVTAHHGSLAKEHRLAAEQRLKQGSLKALVATASLELGIDIGDVDLVCQLGSPRAIATFLQRAGRSGHHLGGVPKGRLFPLSRDDLVECTALLAAIAQGELDRVHIPEYPLDVLAQQIVAEVSCQEWSITELYQAFQAAWPYRGLGYPQFIDVVKMLADGFHTRRGRRGAYLHYDAVHGQLRPRKGAGLTALMNGGAIPDQFDYDVYMQPEGLFVGTLNEDFAFESLPGDIFQLGNNSYRMLKIEQGRVFVEDAHGQPPNIPFWFGEAPGRTDELSLAVSDLRAQLDEKLTQGLSAANDYLVKELNLPAAAAEQLSQYLAAAKAALGVLPNQRVIVFERFLDEIGDMHFVVHSSFGSRINRAWGLALRKRFCRRFNFELQAAASEDTIVLSLGPSHSFPLAEPATYLKAATVKTVLIQALLAAPMFPTRWRWVANTALAVPRMRAGKKVPAYFQRNDAEDLIAVIFPDQLACQENITGDRAVPEHPLIEQTLNDCLHELMDIDGLERLLMGLECQSIQLLTRDLACPSPLALEILNARPYAFLDDAPAEERRTLAVQQRRFSTPESAADMGQLDLAAIKRVQIEAWPEANSPDELHDALVVLGFISPEEAHQGWLAFMQALQQVQRATTVVLAGGEQLWVAAERLQVLLCWYPNARLNPEIQAIPSQEADNPEDALRELIRSRLEGLGPVSVTQLAKPMALPDTAVERALMALQQEGFVIQGQFIPGVNVEQWCERGLLARIHRYTLKQLRHEIEPVVISDFMRFLFNWQGLANPQQQDGGLQRCLLQLEGLCLPAMAWEAEVLPSRLPMYLSTDLDQLCSAGKLVWLRLQAPSGASINQRKNPAGKATAISLLSRSNLNHWRVFAPLLGVTDIELSPNGHKVINALKQWGASFFAELLPETGLLKSQLEAALAELVAWGLLTSDSFQGMRALMTPAKIQQKRSKRYPGYDPFLEAGRWSLLRPNPVLADSDRFVHTEIIARTLLRRYGVVFRKLLDAEDVTPSWRDLLYVFRRLEARGECRGGRFVQGFSGEQFALPEAVSRLRDIRKQAKQGHLITISAVDPLNLTALLTPGLRVPKQAGVRILYRDGVPISPEEEIQLRQPRILAGNSGLVSF